MHNSFIGLKALSVGRMRQNCKISGMHTSGTKCALSCILAHTNFRLKQAKNMPQAQIYLECAFWLTLSVTAQST